MDKIIAAKAIESAQLQGAGRGVSTTHPDAGSGHGAGASSRGQFEAAMRSAEQRMSQSFDVPPQQSAAFAAPDIGSGLQNIAKGFSNYFNAHSGADLKRIIGADPADPHYMIDLAAFEVSSSVHNVQFTVASKMAGQMSKNLDTLFKSS